MHAVYTYRLQRHALIQTEVCASLWDALSRARYDLEHQTGVVVPVSVTVGLCIFHYDHLVLLLGQEDHEAADTIHEFDMRTVA